MLFFQGYLIVSAKLDECNKNFRKANTGRYGETWSDKIAKVCSMFLPSEKLMMIAAGKLKRGVVGWDALPDFLLVCRPAIAYYLLAQ